MMYPLIGLILLSLVIGTALCALLDEKHSRSVGVLFSGIALLLVFAVWGISLLSGGLNITESYAYYIPSFDISLTLQFTAVSFALTLMAAIVSFVTIYSGNVERVGEKTANTLLLLFELAAIGLFASANLFIFFIFWDIGVIALFFMIYSLGSSNRRRAAMKFIIYELLASLLLLFAIMLVYFYTPVHSFDINYVMANASSIPFNIQALVFAFFFIAFLINMPVFPVHLWLPEAHTEASTQGSMVLSGILTKFGGYGMILTFLMIPISRNFAPLVAILAAFSAFYTAFVLMTQHDVKRIVAYTTIVEMSIILVAISTGTALGIAGATYAMLAHGLTISMLFLAAGSMGHLFSERDIRVLKGTVKNAAWSSYSFLAGVFATTGVPLTAAFVGDVLIFLAAINAYSIYGAVPLAALLLLGAFLYYVLNKSVLATKECSQNVDYLDRNHELGFAILIFFIFLFGILPFTVLNFFNI